MAPMRATPEQVAEYREAGYLALGRIADEGEVAELIAEERRFRLPVAYGGPRNQTLLVNVQLCHRSEPVRRFCTTGRHIPIVQRLMAPNVCLTHQQFVTKMPDGAEQRSDIPLHQDNGYGRLEPMTDLTIWMALVDTDERNGGLWLVPGSHRLGLVEHAGAQLNPLLREVAAEAPAVLLPLRAGEAVAFSGLTLHGSGPNRTQAPRPALFVRYCEPGVRMASEGNRPVLEDPHSWMVAGEAGC